MDEFKYPGIRIKRNNTFGSALESLCQQSKRAQSVLDLHIPRHPTHSDDHILGLFDILIMLILNFDCEVRGVENCDVIEKVYLNFVMKLLCWCKPELGGFPLSTYTKKTIK